MPVAKIGSGRDQNIESAKSQRLYVDISGARRRRKATVHLWIPYGDQDIHEL